VLADITEKKEWEARLRTASRLSESMVEHSPRGICLYDAQGNCIAANSLAGEIIGATKEQVLEQNYNTLESWKKSGLLEAAQDTVEKLEKSRIEVVITSSFGEPCMLDVHLAPVPLENEVHLLIMFEDVSGLRQAEWRNARLSRIIEESVNEIYLFDPESLKFTEVNNAAVSNLGYTREELLALSPSDLKPEYSTETFAEMIEPLRTGREDKLVFETIHQRKDDSHYNVEVHLQLLSHAGEEMFADPCRRGIPRRH